MDLELRLPAWILYPGNFFEENQTKICPARIELAFTVFWLYGFPSADFSGFFVKKGFNMVDNSTGSMISSATGIFLSFLHPKVGSERLVYFKVTYHIVLNLYFLKWIGSNLRRTEKSTRDFLHFKDIDSVLWWLFFYFPEQHLLMSILLDSIRLVWFPSMLNKRKEKLKFSCWLCFSLEGNNRTTNIDSDGGYCVITVRRFTPRDVK